MKWAMHGPAATAIRAQWCLRRLVVVHPLISRRMCTGGGHRPQVVCAQGFASFFRPSTVAICHWNGHSCAGFGADRLSNRCNTVCYEGIGCIAGPDVKGVETLQKS